MEERQFGTTNLRVSAIGLGCARIGGIFQGDTGAFVDLLHAARDAGITFFDTADMYSQGESESLLGRAFRSGRDRVIIASKAGYRLPAQRRWAARLKPVLRPLIRGLRLQRSALPAAVRGALAQDFSPDYLRGAVEASLRRLHTDYLDVFQLHSPPAEVVARGEWVNTVEAMQREGKILCYGVSVDTVEAGLAALDLPGVACVQLTINLLEQSGAAALLPRASSRGVAVIARECLANGLLIKDERELDLAAYCRSPEEQALRAQQLVEQRRRAAAADTTLASLALDHVLNLEGVSVSLVGARNRQQLTSLLQHVPRRHGVDASERVP